MKWLTEAAVILCQHEIGVVKLTPVQQDLVTIGHVKVLVEHDPELKPIAGCPNSGATIKPCMLTQKVEVGYSDFLRIDGQRICLDTVTGLTDGTPPGLVKYTVHAPGQELVTEVS
ncbi:hypothetical protein [Dictyobacter arantiisoli]|uniref:Uncharacterized protein n=1 Tax=Dictyobacter arantiisoli TaxID=2014874 RepID=A0A5A5TFT8_9CHLR|nr:hypothetical protein [Dictyobacter arantiisoli]GCF09774.1 hypothetical protein KDI_33380 [Dictyobacter arantiisoli]